MNANDGFLVIKDNSQTVFRTGAWYGNSTPTDNVPTFPNGYSYTIAYFGGNPTDVCLINANQSQIPPTTCGSTPNNNTAQYLIFLDYQGYSGNNYVSLVRFPRSLFEGQLAPCAAQTHTLQAIFYTVGSNNLAYSVFPTNQTAFNIYTNYTYIKLPDPAICNFTCSPSITSSSHHNGTTSSHHNGTTSSHHNGTTSSHHNTTSSFHKSGSHHNATSSSSHHTSNHSNTTQSSSPMHSDGFLEIQPNSIFIFMSTTFISFVLMALI